MEETAAYLDGPGREESRPLPRPITIAYASESMRLTTRLMQIASWLLVQRAVAEGEMTADQGQVEKNRVRLASHEASATRSEFEELPARLRELVGLAARLHSRILHLEQISRRPKTRRARLLPIRSPASEQPARTAFGAPLAPSCSVPLASSSADAKKPRQSGAFQQGATTPVLARITS